MKKQRCANGKNGQKGTKMMGRTTFIFKTEKSYLRVLKALNDTMYVFCTFKDKEITVFGEPAAQSVGEALDECGIRYDLKK